MGQDTLEDACLTPERWDESMEGGVEAGRWIVRNSWHGGPVDQK